MEPLQPPTPHTVRFTLTIRMDLVEGTPMTDQGAIDALADNLAEQFGVAAYDFGSAVYSASTGAATQLPLEPPA